MFYTKYRPQKFSDVCRPNDAADALSKQVVSGKTSHAYLFVGPRGTGKTTLARILAKAMNCADVTAKGDPCCKCSSCVAIKEGSFVDMIEIDAASNRGIDDIREIKDKIKLAPTMGKNKVYIIDEVHMLTNEAFNALLKTLEEPPKKTTFILCTTELHKVPDTIKSRCQVYRFKRATMPQLLEKLKEITKSEKIKISEKDLEKIALASMGGFRDAETLLQQVSDGEISVDSLVGMGSKEIYIELTDYLMSGNPGSAIRIVSKVYEEGLDLYVWTGEYLRYLRELLFIKSGVKEEVSGATSELLVEMEKQASRLSLSWILNSMNSILEEHKNIKTSFIPQLPVEIALAKIGGGEELLSEGGGMGVMGAPEYPKPNFSVGKKVTKDEKEEDEDGGEGAGDASEEAERKKSKKSDVEDKKVALITLEALEEKWKEFIKRSRELNHSLTALLKSGTPVSVEGKFVILEVFYPFHKERLESPQNRKLVEKLMSEIYETQLSIKCILSKEKPKKLKSGESGNLTDLNIAPAQVVFNKDSVIEAFDGGLPLI
ncbi:DNA polymerase III, subunit gamma and tau [candidate division WWE3 bacterium RIFOXYC1_FULL_42_13]|uniref:DNA polymerase III subunit gamma/tau n=2 Tax=Katanobacteria TaxID=422282 RepID=A0A0G0YMU0_UNCKA|nr:MAG: polymerase III, subunit gamma and tau protein [candidate division WWE3 bacterium GW2011_GWA1_42_12]KKS34472.1 MAG: polymerase III, subunit gamma and tau protein [candidate division WWE3 bacterium GW2011_GWD1_42_14]KKS37949.1 MAG: polymerase III, subunit gamma and tau protein [candidate division WWE3 bacterium GW2011_GWF1_42_14]KKS40256.1 MAG: polymerase III, subunit gamma and tau protein [candidate division WWE3 bacterium GW2011_GWE1_42_16]KKS66253.1 MAG: polymerase III, subunit gamma a